MTQARPRPPKPTHYKVICISMYTHDLEQLDRKVSTLRARGWGRASKSSVIRDAVARLDVDVFGTGASAHPIVLQLRELRFLASNLATAAGLQLAFRAGDNAGFSMAEHDVATGDQTYCEAWLPGCGRPYRGAEPCPCETRDHLDD